jgi:hypothetical protein
MVSFLTVIISFPLIIFRLQVVIIPFLVYVNADQKYVH